MLKKLSVGVLTFAMVAFFSPFAVNAQTISEAELRAAGLSDTEVALFMSLLGGSTTTTSMTSSNRGCDADYLRDLTRGSQGADVQNLQEFLNDAGFTVSATGAGSVGMESMFYGPATAAAVTRMQEAYAADILAPVNLTRGTGYFGAGSRAQVRKLCAEMTTPVVIVDNDNDNDDNDDNDNDNDDMTLRGGEASLENYDLSAGDDSDIEEGQSAEVAEFDFDVEDGDVMVDRVDVTFVLTSDVGDDEPWDVFKSARLMMDGDEVAEMDIDDEDDWLDEDGSRISDTTETAFGLADATNRDGYTLRFSGVDTIVRENDEAMFTLELTAQNNVDDVDDVDAVTWGVFIGERGIRAEDGEEIQNYIGDEDDVVEFEVEEAGEGEELNIRRSSNDPDSATIQVEDDRSSDEYVVFAFDLEAEDGDLEIDEVTLEVRVNGEDDTPAAVNYNDVVRDAYLVIDGEEYDDVDISNSNTATATLSFDIDGDLMIDEDEEVEVELVLEFRAANGTNYTNGTTVQAGGITGQTLVVEFDGADDGTAESGLDSDLHTLQTEGIAVETTNLGDSGNSVRNENGDDLDTLEFTLDLDIEAFEEDAFIAENANTSFQYAIVRTDVAGTPVVFRNQNETGAAPANGTGTNRGSAVASLDSSADIEGDAYLVDEDSTESFDFNVEYSPEFDGDYRLRIEAIFFGDDEAGAIAQDSTFLAVPSSEYRSTSEGVLDRPTDADNDGVADA